MNTVPVNFMRNSPLFSEYKSNRKGAYSHKYTSSEIIPFQNHQLKKIESHNIVEFISNVSQAKLSKRNVSFIPLLKGLKFGQNKYEVFRAADNKYKIFSGEKSYGKFKRIAEPLYQKIQRKGSLICPEFVPLRSYSSVSLRRQKRYQHPMERNELLISGQPKQISPQKMQMSMRNSSVLSSRKRN